MDLRLCYQPRAPAVLQAHKTMHQRKFLAFGIHLPFPRLQHWDHCWSLHRPIFCTLI